LESVIEDSKCLYFLEIVWDELLLFVLGD
jgi:hypothetical protein